MNNLELYWGPQDGTLMEMPISKDSYGHTKRPATLNLDGVIYDISLAKEHTDKKPQRGVRYIGVYRADR